MGNSDPGTAYMYTAKPLTRTLGQVYLPVRNLHEERLRRHLPHLLDVRTGLIELILESQLHHKTANLMF